MTSLLIDDARKASRNTSDCRGTIKALRDMGFDKDAFRRLHHLRGGVVGFDAYCEGVEQFVDDGDNHRVHQRLTYVLLSCPDGALPQGKSFLTLAKQALRLIPPSK